MIAWRACFSDYMMTDFPVSMRRRLTAGRSPRTVLGVVTGQAYYYEVLISNESSAVYTLPVGDRAALAQAENAVLYIDGIINEEVSLVADFDYTRPLTAAGILLYDVLIMAVAAVVYLLLLMLVQQYDERFSHESLRIGRIVRCSAAVLGVLASVALFVWAVVLNSFGGEVWDRLFFAAGIAAADAWLVGFLWRLHYDAEDIEYQKPPRHPPPQKALEDACGQYLVADVEKLYPDSLFWAVVLCAVPVCQCGQKLLPLYKYQMDAHLFGGRAVDELS